MSGRRRRASRHADRGHQCRCGRILYGNGGWSSHKKACRVWKEHIVEALRISIPKMEASGRFPILIETQRNQLAALEKELAQ